MANHTSLDVRGVEKIFISVDESTGRSTMSFAPPAAGGPYMLEGDHTGERALRDAKLISENNTGCTIHGPHFHAARPVGRKKLVRRPANQGGPK